MREENGRQGSRYSADKLSELREDEVSPVECASISQPKAILEPF